MTMSHGTASLPPQERQSWVLNDAVVGVRIVRTSIDYVLAGRELYWIGRTRIHEQGAGSIVIDNPHVSDRHATIELRNGRWIVFDRDSRNGIFVGDERRTMFELVPGFAERQLDLPNDDNYVAPSGPRPRTGTWPGRSSDRPSRRAAGQRRASKEADGGDEQTRCAASLGT